MSAVLAMSPIAAAPLTPRPQPPSPPVAVLHRYQDGSIARELVVQRAAHGTALVVDRRSKQRDDERLVAHLAADEPPVNAELVCADYLSWLSASRGVRPRRVTAADHVAVPFAGGALDDALPRDGCEAFDGAPLSDAHGCGHVISCVSSAGLAIPELRWLRHSSEAGTESGRVVSVRDVIGYLESYEPVRSLTARTVLTHRRSPSISVATLRAELERVAISRIVLNRRLRETVLRAVTQQQVSMSEIAMRCGRVKRDARGNVSGETSWLARRLGLLPEGGELRPTPWIHTDVLALIARKGLALSPREVELA